MNQTLNQKKKMPKSSWNSISASLSLKPNTSLATNNRLKTTKMMMKAMEKIPTMSTSQAMRQEWILT